VTKQFYWKAGQMFLRLTETITDVGALFYQLSKPEDTSLIKVECAAVRTVKLLFSGFKSVQTSDRKKI